MKDEALLFQIQALVDNELSPDEIPGVLAKIEGNYEYRDEYTQLLQLKSRLARVPFPSPPTPWYEPFETRIQRKILMVLGMITGILGLGVMVARSLLQSLQPETSGGTMLLGTGFILLGLSFFFLLGHALWYTWEETKSKSYREIIR